jgi:hypothetical protein
MHIVRGRHWELAVDRSNTLSQLAAGAKQFASSRLLFQRTRLLPEKTGFLGRKSGLVGEFDRSVVLISLLCLPWVKNGFVLRRRLWAITKLLCYLETGHNKATCEVILYLKATSSSLVSAAGTCDLGS